MQNIEQWNEISVGGMSSSPTFPEQCPALEINSYFLNNRSCMISEPTMNIWGWWGSIIIGKVTFTGKIYEDYYYMSTEQVNVPHVS